MNKKLLSSLMAGLMLIPQVMSLSAKNPVSEFIKNNKTLIAGGVGLAAGLAAGIALGAPSHDTAKDVEIEFPSFDSTGFLGLSFEEFLEEVSKILDKGLTVRVLIENSYYATKFSREVYDHKTQCEGIPMDYKMTVKEDINDDEKVVLILDQTKRIGEKSVLECSIQKSTNIVYFYSCPVY